MKDSSLAYAERQFQGAPIEDQLSQKNLDGELPTDARDLQRSTRTPLLSRDDEVRLARNIEEAERAILEAVVSSRLALKELARMAEELREGMLQVNDLVRTSADEDRDREHIASQILSWLRDVETAQTSGRAQNREPAAAAAVVPTALPYPLSHAALDRVIITLDADRAARRGSTRKSIEATLTTICDNLDKLHDAQTRFINANMGLVVSMASRRLNRGVSRHDLIQEGSIGLMRTSRNSITDVESGSTPMQPGGSGTH